jgi:pimeloyl-ACP methyl ester carboxylesterase
MPPLGSGFISRVAEVNGVQIRYWIGGTGPALVLIHGYPENSYAWHEVAPALAGSHTVIIPDFRGAGASSRPDSGYTTRQLADDIWQLVQSLRLGPVDIAGHDWGGSIAYAYAAAHPGDVRRMANLEAGPPSGFGQEAAQNANAQLFWFVWLARQANAESIVNGREREFLTPLYSDFSYKKNGISGAELDGYVCSFSQPGAMHAGFMLYRDEAASAEENKSTAAKKLTIPVLAVGGQHSLGDFGAALQTVAANVRSVVIPDASHFLMSDNPQAVVQTLSGFFRP